MGFYLASKEVIRNRSRFFLFSLVIALITTLVLFIAALAEGLAQANKQYLEKIDAQLILFQDKVELSATSSQIGRSKLNDIRRVEGVEKIGPIGLSSAKILLAGQTKLFDVSIIGVEPESPGSPPVLEGRPVQTNRGDETVLDQIVASQNGIKIGETITIQSLQDSKEQYYRLKVVGITEPRQFLYNPSIFVPYLTWDRIRPKAMRGSALLELTTNIVAVQVKQGFDPVITAENIKSQVQGVDVVDVKTAYESIPGYSVQQTTLNTQQTFTLLIGILVIGGFFQIQILQKIPQIGVLKAIGAPNTVIASSVVLQIVIVTTFGVLVGGFVTLLLSLGLPDGIPIVFSIRSLMIEIGLLIMIGPIGGLVAVRSAIKVEPLTALGLSA